MISWASKKLLNASLVVALLATLTTVSFFNAPVSADAVNGNTGIEQYSERWLRYRAIAACYSAQDVGNQSIDDITGGTWFERPGLAKSWTTTIGYLNEDGKVSCDDGGMVVNSLEKIGFGSALDSFCSMSTAERDGRKDYTNCMTGSGEYDMDGSRDDQFEAFKSAKAAKVTDSPEFPYSTNDEKTKPILYWVGRQSLVTFCGATRGEIYEDSMAGNIRDSKRKVVVNDIDLGTGETVRYVYNLDRDEGDTIHNVWAEQGQDNTSDWAGDSVVETKDMSCADLAKMTWDYDTAFGAFVKRYNLANPEDAGTGTIGNNPNGNSEAVCSAGALGWIFCPLVDFMSTATTRVAGFLEERLVFDRLIGSAQGDAIKTVWNSLLTIANAGLIIAFLVIIFSQATSVGLSSYGIKKLLPKVAAAAVLMNLSFYLCAIAVDLANILGVSIQGIAQAGIDQIGNAGGASTQNDASAGQWAVTATVLIGALVVSAVTGAIFLLLPVLVSAMIAVFTAFLVMAARDVIITLLIIVSPLAILAWILPNTDQWFTRWRKLFTSMLLLFPLIMAIFYGSVLVANTILVTGDGGGDNEVGFMTNLIALAVLTIPLFSLPFIMKSAGGVLDRLGVMVNNRNKGLVDRTRNWSKGQGQRTRENNMARLAKAEWGNGREGTRRGRFQKGAAKGANFVGGYTARRDFKRASLKSDAERIQQNAIADQLQDENASFAARSTLRGETGRAIARARGVSIQDKAIGEEVSAAKTVIENMQFTNAQLSQLATTGSAQNIAGQMLSGDFYQKAAQQQFVATGQSARVHDMLRSSQGMSQEVRESLAYHIQQNYSTLKAKDHTLNNDSLKESLIKGSQIGDPQLQLAAVENMSGLTKETLAGQDAKGVEQLRFAISNNIGTTQQRAKALQVVTEMMDDPQLAGKLSVDSEKQFKAILQDQAYTSYQGNIPPPSSGGSTTPPPAQPPNPNPPTNP